MDYKTREEEREGEEDASLHIKILCKFDTAKHTLVYIRKHIDYLHE